MPIIKIMKITNFDLLNSPKFSESIDSIVKIAHTIQEFMQIYEVQKTKQDIDDDIIHYRLCEMQKFLTRSKKAHVEIVKNKINKNSKK